MPWKKGNRLRLLQEHEASSTVAEVFDEVKAALGIAYVPLPFEAFACYPKFLAVQWRAFRPLLGTREFFEITGRLRAEAYTNVHNYFKVPKLGDGLTSSDLGPAMDLFCYLESAMLLMLSAQLQAFEGPVGEAGTPHAADRVASSVTPEFGDPEKVPSATRRVMEDIRHSLELPYCSDEQRILVQWPELLSAYWQALKPQINTMVHERTVFEIRESAWKCAQETPLQIDLDYSKLLEGGVESEDIANLVRCTELLARGAAISLLNTTFARIGLEGGNAMGASEGRQEERVA